MARPYWRGQMRLSLVSFPVAVYTATVSSAKISLHQLQRGTGCRIRYQKVCPGKGEVPNEDIVKGFEYDKGRYVVIEDEDFDKIRLETKKAIELTQFIREDELDPIYIDKPYYVVPDGPVAEEAYAVVREALRRSGRVALGRVVFSGHERMVAVTGRDQGFVLYTMHPANHLRKPQQHFAEIETPEIEEEEVEVAQALIERKAAAFDPRKFVDRYEEALRDIIETKIRGEEPGVIEEAAPGKVINLMDALKRSLGETEAALKPKAGGKKAAKGAPEEKPKGGRKRA